MATTQARTKQAPVEAFAFDAGRVQFADGGSDGEAAIRLIARSGRPINHWYWGKIVHDLAGMRVLGDRVPLDYCHRRDEIVGYGDRFDTGTGDLEINGRIVQWRDDDRSAELIHKGRAGVPYQASIYFDPENGLRLEEIPSDMAVDVNGQSVQGPALVVREWILRGVAVCPYGADPYTSSELADREGGNVSVTIFTAEDEMPAAPNQNANQETQTQPGEKPGVPEEAGQQGATANEGQQQGQQAEADAQPDNGHTQTVQFSAEELQKFVGKFGAENGAKWLSEGKTYAEACELHAEAMTKDRDAAIAARDEERAKLAAMETGESQPVETQPAAQGQEKTANEWTDKLGENLGAFAASIKLPSRKAA